MNIRTILASALLALASQAVLANDGSNVVVSPDGHLRATVTVGSTISYMVSTDTENLLSPSTISMTLSDGVVFGEGDKVRKVVRRSVDTVIPAVAYKKAEVRDRYNEMTLVFKEFSLVFRAYDEGIAYRFVSRLKKSEVDVLSERAEFNFYDDWKAYIPYVNGNNAGDFEKQLQCSFESLYAVSKLSAWNKEKMAILPLAVAADSGTKLLVMEADLENYPGMYLYNSDGGTLLHGVYARLPKTTQQGGHNMLQQKVTSREDYIARVSGKEEFPWRVIMVTSDDVQLAVNDMNWKLARPAAADADFSWVKPGKVAWEWWNASNLYGVNFRAGVNNKTYQYYIDFAASKGIEYVILDEGWAVNKQADLMQVVERIDLPMLCKYASDRGVGLILWAGYWAFDRDMEEVCRHYSEMGVKGFKVDFMNRDDQYMVQFFSRAAETCAKYHLMIDFHGSYKPVGLNRTWPNVVNYEGVHGLEKLKSKADVDQVTYDVTVPFIRMAAGPMDYTQGAMRNATRRNYLAVRSEPMSQGTRCRQLAEYVIFDSPLNMLCDSPSNYLNEPECTDFIVSVPTVWDESLGVCGKIGKYISLARRSGDDWYVGALTNWDARTLTLDLGFLGEGEWEMEIFRDGVNADKAACDYRREFAPVPADRKVSVNMAPGGGWVCRIKAVK